MCVEVNCEPDDGQRSHAHFQSRPSNRRRAVYRRRSSSRAMAPPVCFSCFYELTERASEAADRLCPFTPRRHRGFAEESKL